MRVPNKAKQNANQRWERHNKDKQHYYQYHSDAKRFIEECHSVSQLRNLIQLAENRIINLKATAPKLKPILKYPGGKTREQPIIKKYLPLHFNNYYEPFVGGGSTWLNIKANYYYINDLSTDLMNLYKYIKQDDQKFLSYVKDIINAWKMPYMSKIIDQAPSVLMSKDSKDIEHFISCVLPYLAHNLTFLTTDSRQIRKQLESSTMIKVHSLDRKKKKYGKVVHLRTNLLTVVKTTVYTLFRTFYNRTKDTQLKTALYWYLREYAYSSMFRFNRHGDFNVPYGGASYNNKSLQEKLDIAEEPKFLDKLRDTNLGNMDYRKYLKEYVPQKQDFIFLDPPYDTRFSTYDKNIFDQKQQRDLAKFLKHHVKALFMLIIKKSPLITSLYQQDEKVAGGDKKLHIKAFDKKYQVSFENRNNKNAKHLIITNY